MTDPDSQSLEARLAAVEAVQERMIDTLDTVTDMLNDNSGDGSGGAGGGAGGQSAAERVEPSRDTLPAWVEWLQHTYTLHQVIRDTWHDHPALIAELEALRAGWVLSYAVEPDDVPAIGEVPSTPEGFDAFQWHDALARLIARLSDHDGRITKARHSRTRTARDTCPAD